MLTLYQFDSCPFCWKVKALLNYAKQPYEIVEVAPFGMKELEFTDHKKVPVLKNGDEIVVESAAIIDYINTKHSQLPINEGTEKWVKWIDEQLVHFLPSLIHPNFTTSYRNFAKIMHNNHFGWFKTKLVRFTGALVMPKVSRKMKKKYGIQNVEKEFLAAIDDWVDNGLNGQEFFGKEKPDLVDCSVFGVLRSSHYLGVVELARNHNSDFAHWYDTCVPLMSKVTTQLTPEIRHFCVKK